MLGILGLMWMVAFAALGFNVTRLVLKRGTWANIGIIFGSMVLIRLMITVII